jgi:hypothetical protein
MTRQTRLPRDARLTRRGALGLALGVGLGGCALNNPLSDEKTPAPEAVRDLAPDVAVAVEAVTLVRSARAAVEATGVRHPALAPRLAPLLAVHAAHLHAVVDAVPDGVDTTPAAGAAYAVPQRPGRALVELATHERTLHDGLVGLALRAESGAFARLLGAMAAAVSQQLPGLAA